MKKFLPFLCLLLVLMLPVAALADARMPAKRGTVTDDADVLSAQTVSDIGEYAGRVAEETDIALHTVIVHFLDGLDVQTYADLLFRKWDLGDDDMLLLVAAGEDSFATVMGDDVADELGAANAENLMYTSSSFSSLIRTQHYDAAFNAYYPALNTLIEKQTGDSIRLGTLFGSQPATVPSVQHYGSQIWDEVMDAIDDVGEEYQIILAADEQKDNGLTAGGWIVLIVLVVIVARQSRSARRGRRSGCGCSPLGWIFGLLGLGFLFRKD